LAELSAFLDCPVYDRYALEPGESHRGPAVIEDRESTTILPVASSFVTDELRHLIITLDGVTV
jgi:N-methylhydantoinase A/oxoprolinase/acetone carboxylase beta subunit